MSADVKVQTVPVCDAVVPVAAQGVVVRAVPGDGGPGAPAHFTPQGDIVSTLTRCIADRDEELWWSWSKMTKVIFITSYKHLKGKTEHGEKDKNNLPS